MKRVVLASAAGVHVFALTAVQVSLVSSSPISQTNAEYASWNIDPSCNRGFHVTNFSNPNLAAAGAALQPSRLRFSGSGCDNLVYGLSEGSPECAAIPDPPAACGYTTPGCLNSTHWNALYAFSKAAKADLIFGISFGLAQACAQGPAYVWNSTNAGQLLSYLVANGQTDIWGFELGNEINNCGSNVNPGCGSTSPCNLQPGQQAAALNTFSTMLSTTLPGAVLIGPDTGGQAPLAWLQGYLPSVKAGVLHAITHHVYNGENEGTYNSPSQLDNSLPEIAWYTNVTHSLYPSAQVWAGEDGPIGGGNDGTCGANTVCGTYGTTLWYADDMAQRAKHGFAQYQRHDLFGGAYGLTNSVTGVMALGVSEPVILRPDFWTNFLWKRTVGTSVWNASSSSPLLRAYAFSGSPPSPYAASYCTGSPLQLVLVYLGNATAAVVSLPAAGVGTAQNYAAWTLAPGPGGPFDSLSTINGVPTAVTVDVSKGDPSTYLSSITQAPVLGTVQAGVTLQRISTTFLCYYQ